MYNANNKSDDITSYIQIQILYLTKLWSLPDMTFVVDWAFIYLLKAYSPVNRSGSPQGFSLNQILHKLNTMQNMDILQT